MLDFLDRTCFVEGRTVGTRIRVLDQNHYRMRIKRMPLEEFEQVLMRDWVPVELAGDAIPKWAQGIPPGSYLCASGTGTINNPLVSVYPNELIPSGALIGGIDVYRRSPDDPVEWNKDWYAVVRSGNDPTLLLVDGPKKDAEHWLNELPARVRGIEILGVPKSHSVL